MIVRARASSGQVALEVADACGGLPPGRIDDLFSPLVQRGENRTGFGLGLAIARQAVEAHGGDIDVKDLPGVGCVFTIELTQPNPGEVTEGGPRASKAHHGDKNRRS